MKHVLRYHICENLAESAITDIKKFCEKHLKSQNFWKQKFIQGKTIFLKLMVVAPVELKEI